MSDMNQLLFLQEDTFTKINKGLINLKKTSKARLTLDYIHAKLEMLEKLWELFSGTHTNLCKSAKIEELKETPYWKKDVWETASETYTEYKCLLKSSMPRDLEPSATPTQDSTHGPSNNLAKLPKIVIPKFSGQYEEWNTFRDLFRSLVHETKIDKVVKLQYLKGLLGGEAEQLVRHISISADNYDRCWGTLTERYNNKRFLCNTILKRLFSQKSSNSESANFLKEILDNTTECLGALANQGVDVSNWDLIVIYMTSLKLDPETRKQWELQSADCGEEELPSFKEFQDFLTKRFRALEFVGTGTSSNKSKTPVRSFHASQESSSVSCKFCKEEHKLYNCEKFEREEVPARRVFVEQNRLCYNCLGDGHSANYCRCRINCRVCRRRHHTLLHFTGDDSKESKSVEGDPPKESGTGEAPVVCFASDNASISSQVLLATALVKARTENGDTRIVRALLDQGSQASFITEATAQLLQLKRTPVDGIISGVGGSKTLASKSMVKLNISSMREGFKDEKITLDVFVLKSITTLLPSKQTVSTGWVSVLPLADPKYYLPSKIDLLLGAEVMGQVVKEGVRKEGALLAQNTTLGWILSGVVGSNEEREATNLITLHQMCHGITEEDYQLKKFWELEADTHERKRSILTEEEKECEKLFADTTTRDPEGRYIVKLPFRDEKPEIKTYNSRRIAEKRLTFLKAKLDKAEDLKMKYKEVLEEYLELGHMEEIPKEEVLVTEGSYLPHFAVVREDKDTTKVRIVFDASCKGEDGKSLNDKMMVGPTLQPELRNLLMRWRLHRICLSADIIKMYRQVKVASSDVNYQRILWREDQPHTPSPEKTNSKHLREFRLLRVTFGTASAPYLAVKALQQVAIDEGSNYPAAAERVKQDFYMDDLLTGSQDIESAKQLYNEMNLLLEKGGFKLQKWSSNSDLFLKSIKETGQDPEQEDGLKLKVDDIMKLLGLTWNRRDDAFQYTVTLPQLKEPVTKRRVISDIARLFDPLGWVAPTVIVAKIIIQKLWIIGTAWDEEVPSTILKEWLTYRNQLPTLSVLRIPRWIQTSAENRIVELHGFSDASKLAYAAVVYLCIVDENGDIHVNLLTAKTKVAPIKQVSIPRLELCGAVLVARLLLDVSETLNIEKRNLHAWTDSTVVLAWLNSHPNRWQTFVANRVSEILTTLDSHQWSHISTKQNPADGASRGLQPSELVENTLWLSGPDILKSKEVKYDRKKDEETNLEENTVHKTHLVTKLEIWDKFSSLGKTIRVIAYCRRYMTWKQRKQSKAEGFLTTQELNEAMEVCIRKCQQENFEEELASIAKNREGKSIKLKNPFKALNPYIDDKQILRVGGRLEMAALSDDRKYPILPPSRWLLGRVIIKHPGPDNITRVVSLRTKTYY